MSLHNLSSAEITQCISKGSFSASEVLQSSLDRIEATDKTRLARVASHFIRTEAMAQLLDQVDCPVDLEIADIYCPKQIAP